jgi:hypothetical protein
MTVVYLGWEIYTYTKRPNNEKIRTELKHRFSGSEWMFGDDDYESVLVHHITQTEVKITFGEYTFGDESDESNGQEMYRLKLSSGFFGYRNDALHRRLLKEVLDRLPWKKRAFLLDDGTRIAWGRTTILKMK